MSKYQIWIWFGLILLTSCKTINVVGNYKLNKDLVSHTLNLSPNNNFSYFISTDLNFDSTKGTWLITENMLELNSFEYYFPYQIIESTKKENDSTIITLKSTDDMVYEGNFITINEDKQKYYLDQNGNVIIGLTPINKITIYSVKGKYTYEVRDGSSNHFLITFDENKSSDFYFKEKVYILKKNKLVEKSSGLILRKY